MRARRAIQVVAVVAVVALAALGWRWATAERPPLAHVSAPRPATSPTRPEPAPALLAAASVDTTLARADLDAEANLRELDALSRTDKPRALELALDADARLSSTGIFAEARRALIVTLFADLGRHGEARAHARSFTERYPSSRYLPLVQGVSGVHPRPRPSQLRDARAPR